MIVRGSTGNYNGMKEHFRPFKCSKSIFHCNFTWLWSVVIKHLLGKTNIIQASAGLVAYNCHCALHFCNLIPKLSYFAPSQCLTTSFYLFKMLTFKNKYPNWFNFKVLYRKLKFTEAQMPEAKMHLKFLVYYVL